MLKKPLRLFGDTGNMRDIASRLIAQIVHADDAEQIVRELNAYDDLLAACEAAVEWIQPVMDGFGLDADCASRKQVLEPLKAAIAASRSTP